MINVLAIISIVIFFSSNLVCLLRAEQNRLLSLSEIIFSFRLSVKDLDISKYPENLQYCVKQYLNKIPPDSNLLKSDNTSKPEDILSIKRLYLKEQITIILGHEVLKDAEAFANSVPLNIEWEGISEGPLNEANFVDYWLKEKPKTPIAPFLYLFKAHRLRAGYEAAILNNQKNLLPILAKKYKMALKKARQSKHPLILCIADDLDMQKYVYIEGQGRP